MRSRSCSSSRFRGTNSNNSSECSLLHSSHTRSCNNNNHKDYSSNSYNNNSSSRISLKERSPTNYSRVSFNRLRSCSSRHRRLNYNHLTLYLGNSSPTNNTCSLLPQPHRHRAHLSSQETPLHRWAGLGAELYRCHTLLPT